MNSANSTEYVHKIKQSMKDMSLADFLVWIGHWQQTKDIFAVLREGGYTSVDLVAGSATKKPTTGQSPADELFDILTKYMNDHKTDVVDHLDQRGPVWAMEDKYVAEYRQYQERLRINRFLHIAPTILPAVMSRSHVGSLMKTKQALFASQPELIQAVDEIYKDVLAIKEWLDEIPEYYLYSELDIPAIEEYFGSIESDINSYIEKLSIHDEMTRDQLDTASRQRVYEDILYRKIDQELEQLDRETGSAVETEQFVQQSEIFIALLKQGSLGTPLTLYLLTQLPRYQQIYSYFHYHFFDKKKAD